MSSLYKIAQKTVLTCYILPLLQRFTRIESGQPQTPVPGSAQAEAAG